MKAESNQLELQTEQARNQDVTQYNNINSSQNSYFIRAQEYEEKKILRRVLAIQLF